MGTVMRDSQGYSDMVCNSIVAGPWLGFGWNVITSLIVAITIVATAITSIL